MFESAFHSETAQTCSVSYLMAHMLQCVNAWHDSML